MAERMISVADFLIESLLADAILLGEWGAYAASHEPGQHVHLDPVASISTVKNSCEPLHPPTLAPPPPLLQSANSPSSTTLKIRFKKEADLFGMDPKEILEFRRQRNRDAMRRSRQKQKDRIQLMRTALQKLTLQFEWLRVQQSATMLSYGSLAKTSHRLKSENFMLQRLIVEHEKTKIRMVEATKSVTPIRVEQITATPAAKYFEFTEVSHDQAQDAISSCFRRVLRAGKTARPLAHWLVDASEPCRTFGWTVSCDISSGNNVFLSMTKRLPGVSPKEAMERTWAVISRERTTDKSPSRRLARSAVLQTIDDSTCVAANDTHHPLKVGVRMRSVTVRFRMTTKNGYSVGIGTLNPQDPAERRHARPAVEFMDVSTWDDFDDDGGSGCVATLRSLVQYDTSENLHLRLVNALCSTWRWENEVTQSPMQVLAAS